MLLHETPLAIQFRDSGLGVPLFILKPVPLSLHGLRLSKPLKLTFDCSLISTYFGNKFLHQLEPLISQIFIGSIGLFSSQPSARNHF